MTGIAKVTPHKAGGCTLMLPTGQSFDFPDLESAREAALTFFSAAGIYRIGIVDVEAAS
jgi:hypothetical protein